MFQILMVIQHKAIDSEQTLHHLSLVTSPKLHVQRTHAQIKDLYRHYVKIDDILYF